MSSNVKDLINKFQMYLSTHEGNEASLGTGSGGLGIILWNLTITSILADGQVYSELIRQLLGGIEGLFIEWPEKLPHSQVCERLSLMAVETSKSYLKRYYDYTPSSPPCSCRAKIEEREVTAVREAIEIMSQPTPDDVSQKLIFIEAMTLPLAVRLTQPKRHWLEWRAGIHIWEYLVKQGRGSDITESGSHFIPFIVNCCLRSSNIERNAIQAEEGEEISLKEIMPTLVSAVKALAESGYVDEVKPELFSMLKRRILWTCRGNHDSLYVAMKIIQYHSASIIKEWDDCSTLECDIRTNSVQDPEKANFIFNQFFDAVDASLPLLALAEIDKEVTLEGIVDTAEHFLVEHETVCDCHVSKRLREIIVKAGGHKIKSLKRNWPFYYKNFWDHTGQRGCNHCFYLIEGETPSRSCIFAKK